MHIVVVFVVFLIWFFFFVDVNLLWFCFKQLSIELNGSAYGFHIYFYMQPIDATICPWNLSRIAFNRFLKWFFKWILRVKTVNAAVFITPSRILNYWFNIGAALMPSMILILKIFDYQKSELLSSVWRYAACTAVATPSKRKIEKFK